MPFLFELFDNNDLTLFRIPFRSGALSERLVRRAWDRRGETRLWGGDLISRCLA